MSIMTFLSFRPFAVGRPMKEELEGSPGCFVGLSLCVPQGQAQREDQASVLRMLMLCVWETVFQERGLRTPWCRERSQWITGGKGKGKEGKPTIWGH